MLSYKMPDAYRTFSFTIRPKCGVSDHNISNLIKKFKASNKNDGHLFYMVSEKQGTERHLHGQMWYEKPTTKDVPEKYFKRFIIKEWETHEYQFPYVGPKCKPVYNNDWINKYMNDDFKEDNTVCQLNLAPEEEMWDSYLPPKEKQEYWQNKKNSTDTQLFDLEQRYRETYSDVTMPQVATFLAEAMFGKNKWLRPLRSHKAKTELANTLYFWLNGVDKECTDSFIDYGEKNHSPGIFNTGLDKQVEILQQHVKEYTDEYNSKWWMK